MVKASKVDSVWFHIGWKLDKLQSTRSEKESFLKGQGLGSDLVAPAEGAAHNSSDDKVTGVIVLIFKTMLMSLRLDASQEAAGESWHAFPLNAQQTRLLNKNEASEQKHMHEHKRAGSSSRTPRLLSPTGLQVSEPRTNDHSRHPTLASGSSSSTLANVNLAYL